MSIIDQIAFCGIQDVIGAVNTDFELIEPSN